MKKHLNTLFVTLEGCWLSKDGDTVKVNAEGTCLLRVPLHNLEGIVTLGWDIGVSPYLMGPVRNAASRFPFAILTVNFWLAYRAS